MKKLVFTLSALCFFQFTQTINYNSKMKLESLTPNIMVKSVNETLDYYTKTLGFSLIDTNPASGELEWGYVMLHDVGLMFQEEKSLKNEYKELEATSIGGGLTLYIRIQSIVEFYAKVKDQVNVIKPMNTTFYGTKEFAIMDPNGFILTFSETPDQ